MRNKKGGRSLDDLRIRYGKSVRHGCDTMGRFQTRVAYLIELLEADYLKRGQRARVDEMIWEAEKDAEKAEMHTPDEMPEVQSREFRAELLEALEERRQQGPHRALQEAVNQLKMPRLRHSDHQSRRLARRFPPPWTVEELGALP
jgi:hypothetical protein